MSGDFLVDSVIGEHKLYRNYKYQATDYHNVIYFVEPSNPQKVDSFVGSVEEFKRKVDEALDEESPYWLP